MLRADVFTALGYNARDPEALARAGKLAGQALENPSSVDRELADSAFHVAALTGDQAFYDKLMAALKNPKSPEEYYLTLYTLARFEDPKLLQRTLITLFRRKSVPKTRWG